MMNEAPREWVIALYSYLQAAQPGALMARVLDVADHWLRGLGRKLTHFGAEGPGFSGRAQPLTPSSWALLRAGLGGLSALDLLVAPAAKPSFDRVVDIGLSFGDENEIALTCAVNEAVAAFRSEEFDHALSLFVEAGQWDFGYAFVDLREREPEAYALGISNGHLPREDEEALDRWYEAGAPDRLRRLRSVFPVNLLNDQQMSQVLVDGTTLREFIGASWRVEPAGGLHLWRLEDEQLEGARRTLELSELLIG